MDFAVVWSGTVFVTRGHNGLRYRPGGINSGASGGARRRIARGPTLDNHPMAKSIKSRSSSSRGPAANAARELVHAPPTQQPGGKLGLIVDRLSTKRGATADELVEATGWQRHSVLGALSRLKSRGFTFQLDTHSDRKAYRLDDTAKPAAQSRTRG